MYRRLAIVLLAAAVFIPPLRAQMRPVQAGGMRFTSAPRPPARSFMQPIFLGTPYFYSDYPSAPIITVPPPQVVVVQLPGAAEATEEKKPNALLIEWQGDRYVRLQGAGDVSTRAQRAQTDSWDGGRASRPSGSPAAAVQPELPPAVLIFRDGRQEEVSSYTIVGTVMYKSKDYWSTGSWTEKIQVADLDVAATLRLNRERGVKFLLPAGPNEVVTRP